MTELYYIQDTRSFSGNSPVWWGHNGSGYTSNILLAGVYSKDKAVSQNQCRETDVPWPKSYIDAHISVTVDTQDISLKSALKGTGIKLNKPKRKRPTTGKTRGNCPGCGKITWDHNPYENAYCRDHAIDRTFSSASGCY